MATALVANGVVQLKKFVDSCQGGSKWDQVSLKDAITLFDKAEDIVDAEYKRVENEVAKIILKEKPVFERLKQKEDQIRQNDIEIESAKQRITMQESYVRDNEHRVCNAESNLRQAERNANKRDEEVGWSWFGTIVTLGALTPVLQAAIAAKDRANGELKSCRKILQNARDNLAREQGNLGYARARKSELEIQLQQLRQQLAEITQQKQAVNEQLKIATTIQTSIKKTLPILKRLENSSQLLGEEVDNQIKLECFASISLLMNPLRETVINLNDLNDGFQIDMKLMESNMKAIELGIQQLEQKIKEENKNIGNFS